MSKLSQKPSLQPSTLLSLLNHLYLILSPKYLYQVHHLPFILRLSLSLPQTFSPGLSHQLLDDLPAFGLTHTLKSTLDSSELKPAGCKEILLETNSIY